MKPADYMLTAEELRLRTRKRKRLVVVLALVVVLVLAAIFGARPASHQIKAWQARRLAQKAFDHISKEEWNEARTEAVAAYQLWPAEPEALRAVARFLSRVRQADALEFWRKLREKEPLTREDLRDEATIALVAGEGDRAAAVVRELLAEKDPEPADWALAAQVAIRNSARDEARAAIEKIVNHPRATEREQLQAALLKLAAASGAATPAAAQDEARGAWTGIEKLARSESAIGLEALTVLARRALSTPAGAAAALPTSSPSSVEAAVPAATPESIAGDTPATTEPTPAGDTPATAENLPATLPAAELSRLLENHPLAKAVHKLLALDLLAHEDSSQRETLLQRGIAQWKDADPADLAVLAQWLNAKREFQRHLDTIPLEKAVKNRDLFLQHVDALGALERWSEIKTLLETKSFPLEPVVQLMYLARCHAQLGEKTASENNWQRALEAARAEPGKMLTLAEYAEKNGALQVAGEAYNTIARALPKLRVAQQGRLRIAQASGDAQKIHAVLAEMLAVWPNDTAIQNDEAYLRLLLMSQRFATANPSSGGSEDRSQKSEPITNNEELITIEQLAARLVEREPASLPHRTLLALARLRQNRPADALQVYADINVPANVLTPSALAVHAAVLAATGNIDGAKTEAAHIPRERLLPEERALIAALLQ